MDKITIRDLVARGIIGVNELERIKPQDIYINVEIHTDLQMACNSDNIEDTISYSTTAIRIKNHAESIQRFTVESLAEDISRICLEDPRVEGVIVRVEKRGVIPFTSSVGVEIERIRKE